MSKHDSALNAALSGALKALLPPPRLPLSDWIEAHVRLPEGLTALPGRVRLHPYQREIADAIGDGRIERVTLVKPVRVGFTMLLSAAIASNIANDPGPVMLLLPTEADARDYMVSDLEPLFAATPAVAGMLASADPMGRNTLLSRHFAGGSLRIFAAKAPRNMRGKTGRFAYADEVDAMDTTAEGDPLTLFERRTLSFDNRKIVVGSTPTNEETSHVLRAYAASDQRIYECPCPSCGAFTELKWAHIQWEPDRPETARFVCPVNGCVVEERHKSAMVAAGRWRVTRPEAKGHAGFRLNALVSPLANATWGKLAAEFLRATDHPDQLQVFVNTILAEGWRDGNDELDEGELAARREPFGLDAIPPEVLLLTAGVDCQDDRLECVILGHSKDGAAFILSHQVLWGPIDGEEVWNDLDGLLKGTWSHPKGGTIRIDAALIDAGDGGHADIVNRFARPRFARRVAASKGVAGFSRPNLARSTAKGSILFLVGVDAIKSQLFARLARGNGIRFSRDLDPVFFEQLTSERMVLRYARGVPQRRFERIPGKRAETLDATVYALAARGLLNLDLDRRESELATQAAPARPAMVRRSAWMEGR